MFTEEQKAVIADLAHQEAAKMQLSVGETKPVDDTPNLQLKVDQLGATVKSLLDIMQAMPAMKSAGYFTDDGGAADKTHQSFGDYLIAIKRGDRKRLAAVYKSFDVNDVWEKDIKDLSGEIGTAGAFTVPTQFIPTLLEAAGYEAVVRPRATIIPAASSKGEIPALDQYTAPTAGVGNTAFAGGVVVTWSGEGSAGTETQPKFAMLEYLIRKLAAYTEVPNELIADSAIGMEALLTSLFRRAIVNMEDYAFLRGNGVGKPLGILSAPATIGVTTATNNVFAYADALAMRARFRGLMGPPAWIMHPGMWPDIGKFEVSSGSGGVFQANLAGSMALTLLGYPLLESEHMPAPDTDDVLLADLKSYVIFDRQEIAIAYSEHAGFTADKGTWRVTKRLDGQPWVKNVITLADPGGSYTISPFVYHDD